MSADSPLLHRLNAGLFVLSLIAGGVLFFAVERSAISEGEKRKLAQMPAFSWKAVTHREYFRAIDDFIADNFEFRTALTELSGEIRAARGWSDDGVEIITTNRGAGRQGATHAPAAATPPAAAPLQPNKPTAEPPAAAAPEPYNPVTETPGATAPEPDKLVPEPPAAAAPEPAKPIAEPPAAAAREPYKPVTETPGAMAPEPDKPAAEPPTVTGQEPDKPPVVVPAAAAPEADKPVAVVPSAGPPGSDKPLAVAPEPERFEIFPPAIVPPEPERFVVNAPSRVPPEPDKPAPSPPLEAAPEPDEPAPPPAVAAATAYSAAKPLTVAPPASVMPSEPAQPPAPKGPSPVTSASAPTADPSAAPLQQMARQDQPAGAAISVAAVPRVAGRDPPPTKLAPAPPPTKLAPAPPPTKAAAADTAPPKPAAPATPPAATAPEVKLNPPNDPYEVVEAIIVYRGRALQIMGGTPAMAGPMINAINRYAHELGPDVTVYFMAMPIGSDFYLPERVHKGVMREKILIDGIHAKLNPNVRAVRAYDQLAQHTGEYLYFNTDHHWTGLGAYYAYTAFAQAARFTPLPLAALSKGEIKNFLGTLYHRTMSPALKAKGDTVEYYRIPNKTDVLIFNGGARIPGRLYVEFAAGANAYGVFLGGDFPLMRVTSDIKNGRRIVVIKDSYGNAFVPYLSAHYQDVFIVDYRSYKGNIKNLILEHGIQEVLFAHNTFVVASGYTAQQAAFFLDSPYP